MNSEATPPRPPLTQQVVEHRYVMGMSGLKRLERRQLLLEQLEGQLGIPHRVIADIADELVVLDQPVIWILGESEG